MTPQERLRNQSDYADDWRTSMAEEAADRIDALERALRLIVQLDDDSHPGLSAWQEARQRAHEQARAALGEKCS